MSIYAIQEVRFVVPLFNYQISDKGEKYHEHYKTPHASLYFVIEYNEILTPKGIKLHVYVTHTEK
jgi:hypothetical protein